MSEGQTSSYCLSKKFSPILYNNLLEKNQPRLLGHMVDERALQLKIII